MSLQHSNENNCQLLGDFGWIIQVILGFISFSSLIGKFKSVKRYMEKNRRTWKI